MWQGLADRIAAALGRRPARLVPLAGGDIGTVTLVEFDDGSRLVAKQPGAHGTDTAAIEARMLARLARIPELPVPAVIHCRPGLLVMEWRPGRRGLAADAEADAGRRLACLHAETADRFGYQEETVIGPLPQPNPWHRDWLSFFRDARLLHMARLAHAAGRLPAATYARIEQLAARLERWIPSRTRPALVHGDLWGGNILCDRGRLSALLDPALYFGDGEMDLAFLTLFDAPGERFLAAYRETRPIAPDFFAVRRSLYLLWPLMVHVRLFGGGYLGQVERILDRFGV
ncbi:MAG: fructosamine kinase family protein [Rhodothalassiaceae bacterium]